MSPKQVREPVSQADNTVVSTFRSRNFPLPTRATDGQPVLAEVDVAPLEAEDFTASEPSVTPKQDHRLGAPVHFTGLLDELRVLTTVVEAHFRLLGFMQGEFDRHR